MVRRYCGDRAMDGLSAEPTRTIETADVYARPTRRRATAVCQEADEITERLVCLVRHPDRSQFTVLSSLTSCNTLRRFDSIQLPGLRGISDAATMRLWLSFTAKPVNRVAALRTPLIRPDLTDALHDLDYHSLLGQAGQEAAHGTRRPAHRLGNQRSAGAFVAGEAGASNCCIARWARMDSSGGLAMGGRLCGASSSV